MHAFREQGALDILVTQLLSPQPQIQLFAAHLLRSCASVGVYLRHSATVAERLTWNTDENKAKLLEIDSVRPLAGLLQSSGAAVQLHAAWALALLLCTDAANGIEQQY